MRLFLLKCAALKKVRRFVWQNRKLSVVGHNRRNQAESTPSRSVHFLEQDSTAVPKFAFRSFCPCGNLVGECLPQTLLMRLAPLKNPSKYFFGFFKNSSASHPVFLLLVRGHHAQKGGFTMRKRYNTPHRSPEAAPSRSRRTSGSRMPQRKSPCGRDSQQRELLPIHTAFPFNSPPRGNHCTAKVHFYRQEASDPAEYFRETRPAALRSGPFRPRCVPFPADGGATLARALYLFQSTAAQQPQ